jgi:hypothetical protein
VDGPATDPPSRHALMLHQRVLTPRNSTKRVKAGRANGPAGRVGRATPVARGGLRDACRLASGGARQSASRSSASSPATASSGCSRSVFSEDRYASTSAPVASGPKQTVPTRDAIRFVTKISPIQSRTE